MIPRPKLLAETTIDGTDVEFRELHDTDGTYWHVMRSRSIKCGKGFSRTFDEKDKAVAYYKTAVDELIG